MRPLAWLCRGLLLQLVIGHERGELSEVLEGVEGVGVRLLRCCLCLNLFLRLTQGLGRSCWRQRGVRRRGVEERSGVKRMKGDDLVKVSKRRTKVELEPGV